MRPALLACLLCGAPALAQPGGVWSGYVRGWVNDSARPVVGWNTWGAQPMPAHAWWLAAAAQQQVATQYILQQQWLDARQREDRDAAPTASELQLRALDAELAQARQQAAERRLAEEARALATQQQLALQQQQLALGQQLLASQQAQLQQQLLAQAPAKQEAPAAEVEPAPAPAPAEKGPDVYRWVDARGVTHYSTKPPPGTPSRKLNADRKNGAVRTR